MNAKKMVSRITGLTARQGALPVSSSTLPARSTVALKGVPGAEPIHGVADLDEVGGAARLDAVDAQDDVAADRRAPARDRDLLVPAAKPHRVGRRALGDDLDDVAEAPGGRLRMSASRSLSICPSSPLQNDRFSSRSCLAVFPVTTKPRPSLPPLLEMLWLTMPITSPFMLNIGPPEFPVLMTASVWKNSARGMARYTVFGAQRALIQPTLSE